MNAVANVAPKDRLEQFMGSLFARQDQIATLLTDTGIKPEVFLAVARRALTKTPDLMGCTPASLMQAFMNAATDGLPPDGRKAAITYFKMKDGTKQAQYNPMVQGLMEVAYRSEKFLSIEAQVVYEGDHFEYEKGDNPFIKHKPTAQAAVNRKIINAYAIAKTTNGGIYREVMEKADLDKIRAVSRAQSGPNKDWPEEMARKAPLRRLWKYLPKTPAMDRIEDHDNETYDLEAVVVTPEKRSLKAGFAPKALTQDKTPTVDIPMDIIEEAELVEAATEDEPVPMEMVKTKTEAPAGLADESVDILDWAASFLRGIAQLHTEAEVADSWKAAKVNGFILKLKAKSPEMAEQLADEVNARVAEIRAPQE